MKKVFLLVLCLALAGLLAVNGTFALPNADEVSEWFQDLRHLIGEALGLPTADKTQFDVSLVYSDNGQTAALMPGDNLRHSVAVANGSESSPAYFRIAIAVQESAWNHMTVQASGDRYAWLDEWRDIEIGDRSFKMMIATCKDELPVGETSAAVQLDVSMDLSITTEQMEQIDADFLQIQVLAVDANAFEDAKTSGKIIAAYDQTWAEAVLDQALPIDSAEFNPFQ